MAGMFAALSKLVTGGGDASMPYKIGEALAPPNTPTPNLWTLHAGNSKTDNSEVTIFALTLQSASPQEVEAAKNAVKRLRTLRHPNILRYIANFDTPTHMYLVTEPVTPLYAAQEEENNSMGNAWGIHQIAKALAFLVDCKMVHRNVCMSSVFVDRSGEWKLGGVEFLTLESEEPLALSPPERYVPPELLKGASTQGYARDMWGLGCLMWEAYNGLLQGPETLKNVAALPKSLVPHYIVLVGANPKSRPSPSDFLKDSRSPGKYLKNDFIDTILFLEEIAVQDKDTQAKFFQDLPDKLDAFPKATCKHKILPQLLHALQFGGAGYQVLAPLLKIGKQLSAAEYERQIVPALVKLFSSPDRATRINLLKQLNLFAEFLSPQVVTSDIFPHVANGFSDTVPAMREHTVKAMILIAPKLDHGTQDNVLLKHLAKLQMDEQAGIRANTTTCLGMIAEHLSDATRQRVLITAFLRATKDPFLHARSAGLVALTATLKYYSAGDMAGKILPNICAMTMDPERKVRDQAFALIKAILAKLEDESARMKDPEPAPAPGTQGSTGAQVAAGDSGATQVSAWANWAGSAASAVTAQLSSTLLKKGGSSAPAPAPAAAPAPAPGAPAQAPHGTGKTTAMEEKEETDDEELKGIESSEDEWHDFDTPAEKFHAHHAAAAAAASTSSTATATSASTKPASGSTTSAAPAKKGGLKLGTKLSSAAANPAPASSWDSDWGETNPTTAPKAMTASVTSNASTSSSASTTSSTSKPSHSLAVAPSGGADGWGNDDGWGAGDGWGNDDIAIDSPPKHKPAAPKAAAAKTTTPEVPKAAAAVSVKSVSAPAPSAGSGWGDGWGDLGDEVEVDEAEGAKPASKATLGTAKKTEPAKPAGDGWDEEWADIDDKKAPSSPRARKEDREEREKRILAEREKKKAARGGLGVVKKKD